MARDLGFDEERVEQVSIVVTELAANLVKHARLGELILRALQDAENLGIETLSLDRGPGIANVDVSLLKTLALTERARLQFRAEGFNVANHANFGLPENDISSPNFGRVLTAGSPRLFQLAVKMIF